MFIVELFQYIPYTDRDMLEYCWFVAVWHDITVTS